MKYRGKTVTARDLTANDAKFGGQFDAAKPQMVVTYDDGTTAVALKSDVTE